MHIWGTPIISGSNQQTGQEITNPMIRLKAFYSAEATLDVIKTTHMIRKGQLSDENIPAYKQFMALAGKLYPQISAALHFMNICDKTVIILAIAGMANQRWKMFLEKQSGRVLQPVAYKP